MGAGLRPRAKALEPPPDPTVRAPPLYSTQRSGVCVVGDDIEVAVAIEISLRPAVWPAAFLAAQESQRLSIQRDR